LNLEAAGRSIPSAFHEMEKRKTNTSLMAGTLNTLPDKIIVRRIRVKKDK